MRLVPFVVLVASLMAMNALGVDAMLPALPQIGRSIGIVGGNQTQWIVTAYLLGMGAAQLVYGALSDRFGRRPVLLFGIGVYTVFSLVVAWGGSLEIMIAARVMQGVGAAATRVLAVSIVRDRFSGRQMARVLSLAFMVFLVVPIAAPGLGQIVMLVAPWQVLFLALAVFGVGLFAWVGLRLPETLHPEDRLPLSPSRIYRAFGEVLSNRIAVGYMLGATLITGTLFGFVTSAQQIYVKVFGLTTLFPLAFAACAAALAVASLLNARVVGRLGSRLVSHAALLAFVTISAAHYLVAVSGHETLWTFIPLQSAAVFCFGLVGSNFSAMAMQPMGHVAGTASSVQGFVSTFGATLLGFVIGQAFNGTTVPLTLGYLCFGVGAVIVVLFTEHGRLFVAREAPIA
jgi:DHA1 family bicyclomycin/chloramphenicol resistance-like MFS transporter